MEIPEPVKLDLSTKPKKKLSKTDQVCCNSVLFSVLVCVWFCLHRCGCFREIFLHIVLLVSVIFVLHVFEYADKADGVNNNNSNEFCMNMYQYLDNL